MGIQKKDIFLFFENRPFSNFFFGKTEKMLVIFCYCEKTPFGSIVWTFCKKILYNFSKAKLSIFDIFENVIFGFFYCGACMWFFQLSSKMYLSLHFLLKSIVFHLGKVIKSFSRSYGAREASFRCSIAVWTS